MWLIEWCFVVATARLSITSHKAQGKTLGGVIYLMKNSDPYVPFSRVTKLDDVLVVRAKPITLDELNRTPKDRTISDFVTRCIAKHNATPARARALNVPCANPQQVVNAGE